MLLFLADRAEHSERILKPNADKLIISDRSLISGIAYAKDFDFEILRTLNFLPQAELCLIKLCYWN